MNALRGLASLLSGFAMGCGFVLSGMADPANVTGFLRIGPGWNPALIGVLASAVAASSALYAIARRLRSPLLGEPPFAPSASRIDKKLAAGSLLFGAGWGLAGYCPGPAIAAASGASFQAAEFLAFFAAGYALAKILSRPRARG